MRAPSHSLRQHLSPSDIVEHAWCAAWGSLRYDPATHVDDTPEFLRIITPGSAEMLLNAVLRFRQGRPVTRDDIERVIAPYRVARRPMQWWLRLDNEPPHLRQQLRAIGMQPWSVVPGMTLALPAWQPPHLRGHGITARTAATRAEAELAMRVMCSVYGIIPDPMRHWCVDNPHFTLYLAWVGDEPAGALATQIDGGIAGFFHVATLPQWRRRGVARAMMAQALLDARQAGATVAALTATPMAEALYRDLGFAPTASGTGPSGFELWMAGLEFLATL
jgi:GNAT superfamily N-acetyltransferase